jgi:nucleotide-binding universal stress UspA family protein
MIHFIQKANIYSMKTILAPTDFSVSSINAVNYAADLAVSINAKLVLFHSIPFPIAVSEISVPGEFIDDMMDAGQRDIDELYEKLLFRTKNKISVSRVVKLGSVEQEIENISSTEKPFAIVLGIRSGKTIERALLGSSIFHIMNHVGFPTLIIPENVLFSEIKQIGMACDFKQADNKLPFETITEWLSLFKAKLDIINVSARDIDFKVNQVTESLAIQTRLSVFKPQFHFLTSDNIAEELSEFTRIHPLDLLMVFPKKHGIFNLFHKKNSKFIITHNQFPILSIHDSKSKTEFTNVRIQHPDHK